VIHGLGLALTLLASAGTIPAASGPYVTQDSAIYHNISDIGSSVWVTSGGNTGKVDTSLTAAVVADAGGSGLHGWNTSGATGVRRETLFLAQQGSTACVFSCDLRSHVGDSPGSKVVLELVRVSDGVTIAHTLVTLTGVLTTYTVPYTITAGEEYFARLSNDEGLGATAGARAYVGAQTVQCVGATGFFASSYDAYHVSVGAWWSNAETYQYAGNAYFRWSSARGEMASPLAWLPFRTAATTLIVECSSTMYQGYVDVGIIGNGAKPLGTGVSVFDGTSWQVNWATKDSHLEHATYSFSSGNKNVDIYNPGRTNIGAGTFLGRCIRTIYVAHGVGFQHRCNEPASSDTIVVIGTSITCGFNPSEPGRYAWVRRVREITGRKVVCDGVGGNIAYNYTPDVYWLEWAAKIAAQNPKDIICDMGTNDAQQGAPGVLSRANYKTYYKNQITAIHNACPSATFWMLKEWLKPTKEAVDGWVNGEGYSLDSYRDAIYEIFAELGSPSWLKVVNPKSWHVYNTYVNDDYQAWPVGIGYDDSTHMNDKGQEKTAQQVALMLAA